jgi:peptide/nickel transport system permease protein
MSGMTREVRDEEALNGIVGPAPVVPQAPRRGSALPAGLRVLGDAATLGRTRVGLVMAVTVAAIAILGPLVAPHSPTEFVGAPLAPPSGTALLGTDQLGRDVLSRVLSGGWTVLWMSLAAATLGVAVGTVAGMLAGYSRGPAGELIMRAGDVFLALPIMVLALLFVALLGARPWLIVLLLGFGHAPQVARVARGASLEVCEREYMQWARAVGISRWKTLVGELLPNITSPMLVEYGLRIVWSIALVASLSVLGAGMQPPLADWGLMINENRGGMGQQPWSVLAPLLCIGVFALAMNLITDGIGRAASGMTRDRA